jgi:hypothetical protein
MYKMFRFLSTCDGKKLGKLSHAIHCFSIFGFRFAVKTIANVKFLKKTPNGNAKKTANTMKRTRSNAYKRFDEYSLTRSRDHDTYSDEKTKRSSSPFAREVGLAMNDTGGCEATFADGESN